MSLANAKCGSLPATWRPEDGHGPNPPLHFWPGGKTVSAEVQQASGEWQRDKVSGDTVTGAEP
jgi:hypothetical protein